MNIITAIDEKYLPALTALHNSYLERELAAPFYCFVHGNTELVKHVESLGITTIENPGFGNTRLPGGGVWKKDLVAMYSRVLIPKIFSGTNLWVDADCLILKNIDELKNFKFHTSVAVPKTYIRKITLGEQIEGLKSYEKGIEALTCGVMLINSSKWNKDSVTEKCIRLMNDSKLEFKYVVQSVLSYVFKGEFTHLPKEYEYYANRGPAPANTKIIHYVGGLPWEEKMYNSEIWEKYK